MALTNPIAPFLWGAGGAAMSPEQVAREREIAAALMQGGVDYSPVDHWMQGLARAAQASVGALKGRWADEAETRGREGFQSQWDSVFGGGSSPVASALAGGGAASQSASTANTPPSVTNISGNKQAFVDALLPAAMEASARTGVDPRIIIAQAAQETGWGKSAPGNNYFGIKSHGQGGGQTLNTHEYVNGQRVNVSDSFRTFGSPEESVAGYADFLLANPRYRPMMAAQGLDAQLEALGASGYATDPEYANSVGSIARGITIPDGFSGASAAPAQVAPVQAAQGPDMAALLGLAGNQWANPQQQAVVQALMGQQIQQQDPMYQLQRQKAEIELEAMRNPAAPAPVWEGGQWWDLSSGVPTPLTEAAPDGDTAREQQIARMMETGIDRHTAINIVDGRWRYDANPVTGAPMITDMATGQPVHQPATPEPTQVSQGDPAVMNQFGTQYPAAQDAFGLPGAAAGALNTVGGAFGVTPYPEIQQSQADFAVLRESLLNDVASNYGRQPPSWLLQEIRNLTPAAGSPFEGPDAAISKLNALGRHLQNELNLANEALQRELSPTNRQELEARKQGLEAGIARVTGAISAFGQQQPAQDAGQVPEGVPPELWQVMTPEERALWQ